MGLVAATKDFPYWARRDFPISCASGRRPIHMARHGAFPDDTVQRVLALRIAISVAIIQGKHADFI